MFDRIKRSFNLVGASVQVLRKDSRLMLFPVMSASALVLVLIAFVLPVFGFHSIDGLGQGGLYSMAFLFYVVNYFVMTYFNVALVGAVMTRLDGGTPTLGGGLRVANSRLGAILGYAVMSATIGVILRAIQERVGFIGRIVVGMIGASWALATFLVVPVLVTGDRGAIGAVSESAALLKRTWGENLVGQTGLGAAFGVIYFLLFAGLAGVIALAGGTIHPFAFVLLFALVALVTIACVLAHATLTGIYSAILYRYAVNGSSAPEFDGGVLASAFHQKS